MNVSIIIIHHTDRLIDKCVDSLKSVNAEKIVVTSDFTWSRHPSIHRCLYTHINNPCFKRNQGAKLAHYPYLCFLDDDVEVTPHTINNMLHYLNHHTSCGMAYATLYRMDDRITLDTSGSYLTWCGFLNETYQHLHNPTPIMAAKSACCMVRKDLFFKLGQFDESFVIYGEETDLSWRVWLSGSTVIQLPQAIAYHAFDTYFKPQSYYNKRYIHFNGSKNYITMLIKNLGTLRLYIALLNACIWIIAGCGMYIRNRQAGKWIFQGVWYNVINLKSIWKKRQDTQSLRKVSDKYLFKHVYRNPSLTYYLTRFKEYLNHQLHG